MPLPLPLLTDKDIIQQQEQEQEQLDIVKEVKNEGEATDQSPKNCIVVEAMSHANNDVCDTQLPTHTDTQKTPTPTRTPVSDSVSDSCNLSIKIEHKSDKKKDVKEIDDENNDALLQKLSINNPFYRFFKHSTSLPELKSAQQQQQHTSDSDNFKLKRKIHSDSHCSQLQLLKTQSLLQLKQLISSDYKLVDDNIIITNPFSIFHDDGDGELELDVEALSLQRRLVHRPLVDAAAAAAAVKRRRQTRNVHTKRVVVGGQLFKRLVWNKWSKTQNTKQQQQLQQQQQQQHTLTQVDRHLKKLKINYPNSTHGGAEIRTSYLTRLQNKTRASLLRVREKYRNWHRGGDTKGEGGGVAQEKETNFHYISDSAHISRYEAHCKQTLLYKSYKSEFELSKNLHYLDAYLQEHFEQNLHDLSQNKRKTQSVGRVTQKQCARMWREAEAEAEEEGVKSEKWFKNQWLESDSLPSDLSSSSEYATVFNGLKENSNEIKQRKQQRENYLEHFQQQKLDDSYNYKIATENGLTTENINADKREPKILCYMHTGEFTAAAAVAAEQQPKQQQHNVWLEQAEGLREKGGIENDWIVRDTLRTYDTDNGSFVLSNSTAIHKTQPKQQQQHKQQQHAGEYLKKQEKMKKIKRKHFGTTNRCGSGSGSRGGSRSVKAEESMTFSTYLSVGKRSVSSRSRSRSRSSSSGSHFFEDDDRIDDDDDDDVNVTGNRYDCEFVVDNSDDDDDAVADDDVKSALNLKLEKCYTNTYLTNKMSTQQPREQQQRELQQHAHYMHNLYKKQERKNNLYEFNKRAANSSLNSSTLSTTSSSSTSASTTSQYQTQMNYFQTNYNAQHMKLHKNNKFIYQKQTNRYTPTPTATATTTSTSTSAYHISALNYYGTGAAVDSLYAHTYATQQQQPSTTTVERYKFVAPTTIHENPNTSKTYVLEYEC